MEQHGDLCRGLAANKKVSLFVSFLYSIVNQNKLKHIVITYFVFRKSVIKLTGTVSGRGATKETSDDFDALFMQLARIGLTMK